MHSPLTDREQEKVVVSAACKRAAVGTYDCRPRKIIRKEVVGTEHLLKPDTVNVSKLVLSAVPLPSPLYSLCYHILMLCKKILRLETLRSSS